MGCNTQCFVETPKLEEVKKKKKKETRTRNTEQSENRRRERGKKEKVRVAIYMTRRSSARTSSIRASTG